MYTIIFLIENYIRELFLFVLSILSDINDLWVCMIIVIYNALLLIIIR